MCLTAIAAIDVAGGKLSLWIICRGTTAQCEKRYREAETLEKAIREGDLVVLHEEHRWTSAQLARKYLRWLNRRYREKPSALLGDVFAYHRCGEAKELASQLNIRLEFVPVGLTGKYQPLDRRIL
jgi:hypothetical protein